MQIPSTFHSSTWLRPNAGREPRSPPKYPGNFSYRITSLPKCIYSIRCSLPFRLFVSTPFALTTTRTTGLGECIRPIIRTCYEKQTATLDCGESMQFTMKSTRTYWKYNSPRENFPSSISLLLFHSFFVLSLVSVCCFSNGGGFYSRCIFSIYENVHSAVNSKICKVMVVDHQVGVVLLSLGERKKN